MIYTTTLTETTCCSCGITFAMPENFLRKKKETHANFYCPNGHTLHYAHKSEAEELKDKLAREKSQHDQTLAELEEKNKTLIAIKGHLTRQKKRIAAGVCPCCNRTFQNVHRHMESQHPEFCDKS